MASFKILRPVGLAGSVYAAGQEAELEAAAKADNDRDLAHLYEGDTPALQVVSEASTRSAGTEGTGDLAGVTFASEAAANAAGDSKLTAADFTGKTATGKAGFSAADVKTIAAAKAGA